MRSGVLAGLFALVLAGCGGPPYVDLEIRRPGSEIYPVWVAVFLCTDAGVLEGVEASQLVNRADDYALRPEVLKYKTFPVHSGEPSETVHFGLEGIEAEMMSVVVVANIPGHGNTWRQDIRKGDKLTFAVSVARDGVTANLASD